VQSLRGKKKKVEHFVFIHGKNGGKILIGYTFRVGYTYRADCRMLAMNELYQLCVYNNNNRNECR
jgi:hypothetical protein